jgi:hypothetical protein
MLMLRESSAGTCRHRDIGPFACLQDVLHRLPSDTADRLVDLLPDVRLASHPLARRKRPA